MSDLLNIGSSGLSAYRTALAAIGENVANAETPGYARRSVVLRQAGVAGGADLIHREAAQFSGVTTAGVARAWDNFRATEARYAESAAGRAEVRHNWLRTVEGALDDGPTGVGASLTSFFNAGTALAASPADPLVRSSFLAALGDVAMSFRGTSEALARAARGMETAAGLDADTVNNALAALHNLNGSLRVAPAGGTARAALEDQRDRLIDQIASRLDIEAAVAGDGTVSLRLAASPATELLTGTGPGLVRIKAAADGRLSLHLSIGGTTMPLPASGGSLAGLVEVSSVTADRRAALDALAADFVAQVNQWSAAGIDRNGAPGVDLLAFGGSAESISVLVADPALIPAASPDGTANGNVLALDALRGPGNAEARWATIVSASAQMVASAKSEAAAAASWRDQSWAALDEHTGIDLDFEAAQLLRFQQAYSAATRIIQVARETLDAVFKLF